MRCHVLVSLIGLTSATVTHCVTVKWSCGLSKCRYFGVEEKLDLFSMQLRSSQRNKDVWHIFCLSYLVPAEKSFRLKLRTVCCVLCVVCQITDVGIISCWLLKRLNVTILFVLQLKCFDIFSALTVNTYYTPHYQLLLCGDFCWGLFIIDDKCIIKVKILCMSSFYNFTHKLNL